MMHLRSLLSKNGGTEALAKRIPPRTMGFPRDAVSGRSRSSPSAVQDPRGPTPGSGGPRPIPEGSPANPREPRKRSWTGVTASNPGFRTLCGLTYDSEHSKVVLFDGFDQMSMTKGDTWEYDGTNWTKLTPHNNPSPR